MNSKLTNGGIGYRIFMIFNVIFMLIIMLATLFPYLNVLAKALNDGNDSMRGGITIFPRVFTLENFRILLSDASLYSATIVTINRVILTVFGCLLVQFMTAYVLTKKNLIGLKWVNIFFLIPMFIGGGLIPQYILYSKIGLLNNFFVYILPGLFSFYNVMIIRTYITTSIPEALSESALIDGANEYTLFFRIILPLCKPILATIALWTAVNAWNDWTTTLMFIQKPSLYTLQYKLMQTIKETERITALIQATIQSGESAEKLMSSIKVTPDSLISAQIIVVTIPIICVYPFLQKYFVKGITLGSVKG